MVNLSGATVSGNVTAKSIDIHETKTMDAQISGSVTATGGGELNLGSHAMRLDGSSAVLTLEKDTQISSNKPAGKTQIDVRNGASLVSWADVLLDFTRADLGLRYPDPGAVQVDGKSSVTLKVFGVLNNNFSTEHIRDTLGMAEGSTLNFEIDQSEWDQYKNDDGTYTFDGSVNKTTGVKLDDNVTISSPLLVENGTTLEVRNLDLSVKDDTKVTGDSHLILGKNVNSSLKNIISDGSGNLAITEEAGTITAADIGGAGADKRLGSADVAGSLVADSLYSEAASISGTLNVKESFLDNATLTGTIAGGKTSVSDTLSMSGAPKIQNVASVTAKDAALAEGAKATIDGTLAATGTLTLEKGSVSSVNGSATAMNIVSSGSITGRGTVRADGLYTMKDGSAIESEATVTAGTATAGDGAVSVVDGSLSADSLAVFGAVKGTGDITVNEKADVSGSLSTGTLTLDGGSSSAVSGIVAADILTASGTVTGSGKFTVNEKAGVSGSLSAESFYAKTADIAGNFSAKEAVLDSASVTGSVAAESLTAAGSVSGTGTLTAGSLLTLGNDLRVLGRGSVTAETADFGGHGKVLTGSSAAAPAMLTVRNFSSSGTEGVMNGSLTSGQNTAFYIGDTAGGTDLFKSEAREIDGSSQKALGFIDRKIRLTQGSSITVDGTLTSAPGASAVSAASLRTAAVPTLVLNGQSVTASSSASQADTVTVGKGSKLTVSAAALEGGAAVIFEKGGTVNNAGTIELTRTDIAANEVVKVFGADSGSVTDNTSSLSGQYTMLNGAFVLDPLGDGSVKARFEGVQDGTTDSSLKGAVDQSIKDPVNQWIAAGNTVKDGSFLSDAMSSEETAKTLNSAARFSVLSGTVQNSLLAERAAYDSVSERLGFGAASIARQGNIEGTSAGVWLQPVYMHYDSDGFSAVLTDDYGVSSGLYGTVLGADVKFGGNYIVGAAFSTGTGTSHSDGSHSYTSNDFDFYGGSLYGSMEFGSLTIAADTGITRLTGDAEQTSPIGKLRGDADADVWTTGVQARYDIKAGNVTVAPHAGVRYTKVSTKASDVRTEKGASIRSEKVTVEQETFPVGVKVSSTFRAGDWSLSPAADASLILTAGDKDVTTHTNLGSPEVSATSDISDTVSWDVKAGLNAQYGDSLGLGISAGFGGSQHTDSEARIAIGARFEF